MIQFLSLVSYYDDCRWRRQSLAVEVHRDRATLEGIVRFSSFDLSNFEEESFTSSRTYLEEFIQIKIIEYGLEIFKILYEDICEGFWKVTNFERHVDGSIYMFGLKNAVYAFVNNVLQV